MVKWTKQVSDSDLRNTAEVLEDGARKTVQRILSRSTSDADLKKHEAVLADSRGMLADIIRENRERRSAARRSA